MQPSNLLVTRRRFTGEAMAYNGDKAWLINILYILQPKSTLPRPSLLFYAYLADCLYQVISPFVTKVL